MICPRFIFENPNFENKEDDNNNTSRNVNYSPFPDESDESVIGYPQTNFLNAVTKTVLLILQTICLITI